jgi:hypothetical protein
VITERDIELAGLLPEELYPTVSPETHSELVELYKRRNPTIKIVEELKFSGRGQHSSNGKMFKFIGFARLEELGNGANIVQVTYYFEDGHQHIIRWDKWISTIVSVNGNGLAGWEVGTSLDIEESKKFSKDMSVHDIWLIISTEGKRGFKKYWYHE